MMPAAAANGHQRKQRRKPMAAGVSGFMRNGNDGIISGVNESAFFS